MTGSGDRVRIGVMFRCATPAEELPGFARRAETAGFDEIWVVEDCFHNGGVAAAAAALAATARVRVGIGILPAAARNAAFTAMEFATLARLHPGRFVGGLGHGMPGWMAQVGAAASPLTALAESVTAVRSLLRGATITEKGRYTQLDEVALDAPSAVVPPVYLGVRGPRSLELAGRAADGTILAEPVTAEYLHAARARIAEGAAMAGRDEPHPVVAYSLFAAAADPARARAAATAALRRSLVPGTEAHLAGLDFAGELTTRLRAAASTPARVDLDDRWVDKLTVSGTPAHCAARISALHEAGADSVCLIPTSDHEQFFVQSSEMLAELEGARR